MYTLKFVTFLSHSWVDWLLKMRVTAHSSTDKNSFSTLSSSSFVMFFTSLQMYVCFSWAFPLSSKSSWRVSPFFVVFSALLVSFSRKQKCKSQWIRWLHLYTLTWMEPFGVVTSLLCFSLWQLLSPAQTKTEVLFTCRISERLWLSTACGSDSAFLNVVLTSYCRTSWCFGYPTILVWQLVEMV